jgi:hypothetical protein
VFLDRPPPPSFDLHKHNGDDEPEQKLYLPNVLNLFLYSRYLRFILYILTKYAITFTTKVKWTYSVFLTNTIKLLFFVVGNE